MAKLFIYKEVFTNRYICNGKAVEFEPLDGNSGVGVFEDGKDDELIKCLKHAASQHQGGIVIIDEAQYEESKKNRPYSLSAERSKQEKLRIMPHRAFGPKEPGAVAAEMAQAINEAKSAPAQVAPAPPIIQSLPVVPASGEAQLAVSDSPAFKPATRRMAKEKVS